MAVVAPSHISSAFYILLSFLCFRIDGISSWWAMCTMPITCHYYFIKVKEVTHEEEHVLRKCWFVIIGPKHIKKIDIDISCKETSFNHQEYITFTMNLLSIWTGRKKWINTITPLECERKQDSSTLPGHPFQIFNDLSLRKWVSWRKIRWAELLKIRINLL